MADNNNSNMNQPLSGGGGGGGDDVDSVSQTSQSSRSRRSGSLLERIQAQRTREQQPQQREGSSAGPGGRSQGSNSSAPTPSHITIPNYSPATQRQESTGDIGNFGVISDSNGWGGVMSSGVEEGGVSSEALLGDHRDPHSQYSMAEYFKTFVLDVYNLFVSLPIWIQIPLLGLMIFLVIKLI